MNTNWVVIFYSTEVEEKLLSLPSGFLSRFIHYAERMEIFGPNLGMPYTRAMGGGLFELRIKSKEGIARIFYCTIVLRRIVVLHHFIKKSRKTPRNEIEIARKRMRELKSRS